MEHNEKKITFLDGAAGTMFQAAGLKLGARPELLSLTDPDIVSSVHRQYVDAGSDIIYANTFGANAHKLAGTGHDVEEVIAASVAVARAAAGEAVRVALDVGPLGELLEPLGTLSFEDAYALFAQVVEAGAKAGADLIVFETMTDLYEVKAAVLAAKEHSDLPIFVTMSFEENGRTFTGCTPSAMAMTLTGLGVDALGVNCSLGPKDLYPIVEEMTHWTSLPLIVKPNAGLPDPETGGYTIGPKEFVDQLTSFLDLGVAYFGGCCGTNPDFIRALTTRFADKTPAARITPDRHGVCTPGMTVPLDRVRVIGERINPTGKKRFQQALREHDLGYILERGVEQADAGADILDVNVGLPGLDEPAMMTDTVKALQSVLPQPLQIDTSDPAAMEAGLRCYNGKPIANSVNGKAEVLRTVLPLVKKYGAAVVGLTMDENGLPATAQARFDIAQRILNAALSYGIPREDVYIDCLTLTVSAQPEQTKETLTALRRVTEELGLHTVLGVSNISFGLPARELVTRTFLIQAMAHGLDLPLINPNQTSLMDAVAAFRVLDGTDPDSAAFIQRFASAPAAAAAAPKAAEGLTLPQAVSKGLKEECAALTKALLETQDELSIVNEMLIPALDQVGELYEKGTIFLPQLISSANAACAAFDVIKTRIAQKGSASVSKGKIIVATVQGDIHDIGKNIVKVILENYGYQVIDLGRDVPPEKVVEAAQKENVSLVGLSALMTTTVPSMEKTIAALRASGHPCRVFVGGAVLTPDYAKKIGADYYAKDAKRSVDIAKEVLG